PIGRPEPLIGRLEESQVNALVPTTQAEAARVPVPEKKQEEKKAAPAAKVPTEPAAEIDYADFAKVALKVGKVLAAEPVPKADKLLKLTVDVGEGTPRTIAAGIALSYRLEQLVGRNVVVVANLKPRALRGIESRGMLLAAGADEKCLSLVDPGPLPPGSEVK
ncbi:MAG: methionine--tRNA ligase subunit beta, partial [Deltaproteobacteria bacterium]|nr:methionine--tRNA ligase subunit beta [Deltaproteobacteria bacterium]